jgi:hypothetical protein
MTTSPTISVRAARRLALHRAGLLKPDWLGLSPRARGRAAAHRVIELFGYLQLDTVSIAGARSHALVLMSRLDRMTPKLAETLLQPGEPLFEYWGHEASWIPLSLYPYFAFRRRAFRKHPWWGDVVGRHPRIAAQIRARLRDQGPIRSSELEGRASRGWWDLSAAKQIASALWSSGELVVIERQNFQRTFDLAERAIPSALREQTPSDPECLRLLALRALQGHGWATTGTIASTWRLAPWRKQLESTLQRLGDDQEILACRLRDESGRRVAGWIRPADLELADHLDRVRPSGQRPVLLSPFDPVLWDRARVRALFGFDQVLEIFKPAALRTYGYYCLPILCGERLVARVDLKAERTRGSLRVLAAHFEAQPDAKPATRGALERYAETLQLRLVGSVPTAKSSTRS